MDQLYEALNLEGFQALISFIDQGGHAKLASGYGSWNTNNSETVKTHVKNVNEWQCHKEGLIDNVLREFCGVEKLGIGKEFKQLLKAVGIAVGVTSLATAGVAIGMAVTVGIAAFPPIGIAIAVGVAVGVGVVGIAALVRWAYKAATQKSATAARFESIQAENTELAKEEGHEPDRKPSVSLEDSPEHEPERNQNNISPPLVDLTRKGRQVTSKPTLTILPTEPSIIGTGAPLNKGSLGATKADVRDTVVTEPPRDAQSFQNV
ncbi:hypothetical protein [Legionella waltersii]|uniref:Transmembrane protein n=1 Tax=Legionella waltersii TaxID=66969 RepID=A0A0W1A0R2_9GAMM|nr:hypothetical protein [Legionella waltersii]KTD74927.1 hypothetical protein Lwal_2968 [Legionella waltersii]SNV12330.1 Uncharacterised protein [Legionella waltersii]